MRTCRAGLEQAAGSESVLPLKLTVYLVTGVAAWSRLNHTSATLALLAWPDLGVEARTILQVCLPSSSPPQDRKRSKGVVDTVAC